MKTYKVIFMAFAAMVLGAFVITSCSNEENPETQTNNNFSKREGILDLSEDSDFIELYNLVSAYAETEKDAEQIRYFTAKIERDEAFSNEEMELFAHSMGYESRNEAAAYLERFVDLSVSLDSKYDLFDMGQGELEDIFIAGFENINTTTSNDNCYYTFNACYNSAEGSYAGQMLMCVGLGVTIAGANWWNAGLVGYLSWALCAGAATYTFVASVDTCLGNWAICMDIE